MAESFRALDHVMTRKQIRRNEVLCITAVVVQLKVQSCLPLVIMIPRAAARVIPKIIRPMTTTKTQKNKREIVTYLHHK